MSAAPTTCDPVRLRHLADLASLVGSVRSTYAAAYIVILMREFGLDAAYPLPPLDTTPPYEMQLREAAAGIEDARACRRPSLCTNPVRPTAGVSATDIRKELA